MGAFLAIIYKVTNYKIKRDEETCIHCNKCTKACPVNIDVAKHQIRHKCRMHKLSGVRNYVPHKERYPQAFCLTKICKTADSWISRVIIYVGIIEARISRGYGRVKRQI
jgi:L-lactate utilization protein LutB